MLWVACILLQRHARRLDPNQGSPRKIGAEVTSVSFVTCNDLNVCTPASTAALSIYAPLSRSISDWNPTHWPLRSNSIGRYSIL